MTVAVALLMTGSQGDAVADPLTWENGRLVFIGVMP